jgi:hypothetical protein
LLIMPVPESDAHRGKSTPPDREKFYIRTLIRLANVQRIIGV